MYEKKPTYRVEIRNSGTLPNETYGWEVYRNLDVLPILRSQQLFVSRVAGLADANRSRLQLVDTDLPNLKAQEPRTMTLFGTMRFAPGSNKTLNVSFGPEADITSLMLRTADATGFRDVVASTTVWGSTSR